MERGRKRSGLPLMHFEMLTTTIWMWSSASVRHLGYTRDSRARKRWPRTSSAVVTTVLAVGARRSGFISWFCHLSMGLVLSASQSLHASLPPQKIGYLSSSWSPPLVVLWKMLYKTKQLKQLLWIFIVYKPLWEHNTLVTEKIFRNTSKCWQVSLDDS